MNRRGFVRRLVALGAASAIPEVALAETKKSRPLDPKKSTNIDQQKQNRLEGLLDTARKRLASQNAKYALEGRGPGDSLARVFRAMELPLTGDDLLNTTADPTSSPSVG